jgi:hypothetical protein
MKFAAYALLVLVVNAASAQTPVVTDPCRQFKWDVSTESALFRSSPTAVVTARARAEAAAISPETLYQVQLHPQEDVKLVAPISKKMLDDGAFGGLVKIHLTHPGAYRISVDAGFWVDIADGSSTLARSDFSGSQNCTTPRKVVLYELPAGKDLYVQLTGASVPHALLTVVRVAPSIP